MNCYMYDDMYIYTRKIITVLRDSELSNYLGLGHTGFIDKGDILLHFGIWSGGLVYVVLIV